MPEGNQETPPEEMVIREFFDRLDNRFGRQGCPICGSDDWHFVLEPVKFASLQGDTRADMEVAMAVCRSCRFVRMHMRNALGDLSPWVRTMR